MGRRAPTLRQKWTGIPFERKIAMFVAPVFVFLITGVLIPRIVKDDHRQAVTKGTANAGTGGALAHDEQIEVVDFFPINSLDDASRIEITTRNIGAAVAVLTRVDFLIRKVSYVSPCAAGAALAVSQQYDLALPQYPEKNEVVPVRISQELAPNAFNVGVVARNRAQPEPAIYELEASLFHDAKPDPVHMGTIVIAEPFPESHYFSEKFWSERASSSNEARACVKENIAAMRSVVSVKGVKSPALTRLAQDLQ